MNVYYLMISHDVAKSTSDVKEYPCSDEETLMILTGRFLA